MPKFIQNSKYVLQVARKPDKSEYTQVAKVTALGILLIGFIGFVIQYLSYIIQGISP